MLNLALGGTLLFLLPCIKTKVRLASTMKRLSQRRVTMRLTDHIARLNQYMAGWLHYFAPADMTRFLEGIEQGTRRRLRRSMWKRWKTVRTRYRNLRTLGLTHTDAIKYANTRKGYWRISGRMILTTTLTNQYFRELGLLALVETYQRLRIT